MLLIAKTTVFFSALLLFLLQLSPISLVSAYIILRPLIQPFAMMQYDILPDIPIATPFSVVIFPAIFFSIVKKDWKILVPNSIFLYFLISCAVVSFFNTMSYLLTFGSIIKLITNISIFIIAYNAVRRVKDILTVLYALAFSTLLPLIYGFFQFLSGEIYSYQSKTFVHSTRIDSIMGVANEYGVFLVVSLIAAICLYQIKKRKFFLIYSALIVVQIILSLNRGTWIALLFAVMIASVFYRRKLKLRIVVPMLVIIFLCFSSIFVERFTAMTKKDQYGQSQNTFRGRIEYWKKMIPLIARKPFIGYGFGVAELVATKKLNIQNVPHNDYLRLALEAGIPAFLLYFMFLLMELIRNVRLSKQETNWQLNLPVFILVVYFITISVVQNIFYNMIIPPMVFSFISMSHKLEDQGIQIA